MNAPAAHAPSQPSLLPPAARKQVDEANRLIRELNQQPSDAQPPVAAARSEWVAATPQPSNAAPGVQDPPAPPPTRGAPPPTAAAVAAAAAAAVPAPQDEEMRRLRAAYATLQGKYNSEIAGLRAVTTQQTELLNQLVKERTPAAAPVAPKTPEEVMKALGATDKEIEDFGTLLPVVARIAENMFKPTLAKLEGEIAHLRQSQNVTQNTLVKSRQDSLEDMLDTDIPNWRVINESQEFLDWLDTYDIMAGTTRRVALSSAYKALDAVRVSGIFQAYVREYPAALSASDGPAVDTETLIQPAPAGGQPPAAPGGGASKRIIPESEIRDFYTRVRKKQVSPEEYARFSAEIAAATAEGRVKPDRVDHHGNSR